MTIEEIMNSDIAGRFDISQDEANRIAKVATDGDDFIAIWENDDFWLDDNQTT